MSLTRSLSASGSASVIDSGDAVGPGILATRTSRPPGFLAEPAALLRPAVGDKGTFSKIGSNLIFEAVPSVVHFGGYVLNKVHEQTLRVSAARRRALQ
jgi:hypothetical protein